MPFPGFSTHFPDIDRSDCSTEVHEALEQRGVGATIPKQLQGAFKEYKDLIKMYTDGGSVIHGSATLDESYYHFAPDDPDAQKDRRDRNRTQVVTKHLHPENHSQASHFEGSDMKTLRSWPTIRVNQIWIWTIANSMQHWTLFSSYCS